MSDNILAIKMFDEGIAAYLRNDFKDSIKKFTRALSHDAKFALAYSSRGAARLKSGHTRRAVTDFNRAIRLNPGYARAHHLLGLALEQMGDFAGAYRVWQWVSLAWFAGALFVGIDGPILISRLAEILLGIELFVDKPFIRFFA